MNKPLFLLWIAVTLTASEGERIYMSQGCYGCHGVRGEGIGDYPVVGGKPYAYLVKKLHALKRGIGHTSKRDLMIPFAKALDEEQVEAVSRYLSAIGEKRDEEEVPPDVLGGFGS
jgi:cytochrome c553